MNHIKKVNEFFGGPSSEILIPKLDAIVDKLGEIRTKINNGIGDSDTRKIEPIYNYLVHDMDLHMLATSRQKSDELTGNKSKEKISDKLKRIRRDW